MQKITQLELQYIRLTPHVALQIIEKSDEPILLLHRGHGRGFAISDRLFRKTLPDYTDEYVTVSEEDFFTNPERAITDSKPRGTIHYKPIKIADGNRAIIWILFSREMRKYGFPEHEKKKPYQHPVTTGY